MTLLLPFRLRFIIPLLVVSITLTVELFYTLDRLEDQKQQYQLMSSKYLEAKMNLLQAILSDLMPGGEIERAQKQLTSASAGSESATIILTDENHKILISSRPNRAAATASGITRYDNAIAEQGRSSPGGRLIPLAGRIHAYYPVKLTTNPIDAGPQRLGTLYMEYDYSGALAKAEQMAYRDAVRQSALLIFFALLLSALLHLLITRHIERLLSVMKAVAGGDMSARAGIDGKGEIAQLARAFDDMTAQLAREQEALHEQAAELEAEVAERQAAQESLEEQSAILRNSEYRYRMLVENSPLCIHEIDMDGKISSMNRAGLVMMGVEEEYSVQGLSYLDAVCEADRERIGGLLAQAYEGEASNFEFMASGPDGLVFKSCFVPIRGQKDSVEKLMGITEDITERRTAQNEVRKLNAELEQRVLERTRQLNETIKELESFSYSVSHDLRAPLRSIDGFSQALIEDYPDKLDDQGKDYLRRVRSASQRMAGLIDDMLKLSRVTRGVMKREKVDLSAMAHATADELRRAEPERRVEFIIQDGLTAQGDPQLLRAVLENLFGNSWKFTSQHETARIEFGIAASEGRSEYFVRDDGAGFDTVYADKLFVPFQRLHSCSDFSGTGIGLSIVERIIRRHGGHIRAEGAPERGAVFYFTLQ